MHAFANIIAFPFALLSLFFGASYRGRSKDGLPLPQGAREIGKLRHKQYVGGLILSGAFLLVFTAPSLAGYVKILNGNLATIEHEISGREAAEKILVVSTAEKKQAYQDAKIALGQWVQQSGTPWIAHPSYIAPGVASALGMVDGFLGTGAGDQVSGYPVPEPGEVDTRLTLIESLNQPLPQGVCLSTRSQIVQCDEMHRKNLEAIASYETFITEAESDNAAPARQKLLQFNAAVYLSFFSFAVFLLLSLLTMPVYGLYLSKKAFQISRVGAVLCFAGGLFVLLNFSKPADLSQYRIDALVSPGSGVPGNVLEVTAPAIDLSKNETLRRAELKLMAKGYFKAGLPAEEREVIISTLTPDEEAAYRERMEEIKTNFAAAQLAPPSPSLPSFEGVSDKLRASGYYELAKSFNERLALIKTLSKDEFKAIMSKSAEFSRRGGQPDDDMRRLFADASYLSVQNFWGEYDPEQETASPTAQPASTGRSARRNPAAAITVSNPIPERDFEISLASSLPLALWAMLSALIPFVLMFGPTAYVQTVEALKETKIWREWVVGQKGQDSARWASVLSFWRHDYTAWFQASHGRIIRTHTSPLVLGQTLMLYDPAFGGRWIASTSEQHLLTVAGTGAGKTRDVIAMNTLTYNGGALIFDTKGEHVTNSWERRKAYAPVYLLDPFGKNKLGLTTDKWNPLEEIDPNSPDARERVKRLCQSIIPFPANARGKDAHFVEVPRQLLAGFIAHILTEYPPAQRNLPAVYDLMVLGKEAGKEPDLEAWKRIGLEMWNNPACNGLAQEAAKRLDELEGPERSGMLSTLSRSLEWVKDSSLEDNLRGPSSFSLSECKSKDATVYIIIPEDRITSQDRYLKVFYQTAFDMLDEHRTEQQNGSKRRVLFLFDEFEALGAFEPARQAALRKRSSFIKCWFILQNIQQLERFENVQDFLSNCDLQVFGIARVNAEFLERIQKALGEFTALRSVMRDGSLITEKEKRPLLTLAELGEFLNAKDGKQLFIPLQGVPMKLKRVPYFKIWKQFKMA